MVELLRKFEKREIKIARINSILITKYINLQLFSLIWWLNTLSGRTGSALI